MHSTARNQKILMFMSSTGECRQQKHTQHAPFMKTECDYFNGWIKKMITCAEVSPKNGEPPRSNWERRRRRKRLRYQVCCASSVSVQHHIQLSKQFVCCLLACLTSQQHASVSQGRICSDNFMCCHTEIEVADQTFHLTQSQYTDTGPTSPSTDPIAPGAWQGRHWSANF